MRLVFVTIRTNRFIDPCRNRSTANNQKQRRSNGNPSLDFRYTTAGGSAFRTTHPQPFPGGPEMKRSHGNVLAQPRFVQVVAAIIIAVLFIPRPAWSEDVGGKRDIDVATVNLYVGADVSPITTLNPADPDFPTKLVVAVATVHARILASGFHQRAAALAQEIVARGPDVVALQEVSL